MIPKFLEMIFGVNYKTATGTVMSAISLVPTAIQQLGLTEVPEKLRFIGLICFFVSFIYTGIQQKDKDVTGVGKGAMNIADLEDKEIKDSWKIKNKGTGTHPKFPSDMDKF